MTGHRRAYRIPSLILAMLLAVTLLTGTAFAADPVGRVEKIKGEAQRQDSSDGVAGLETGSLIYVGDIVTTKADGRLRIRFVDTSSLTMGGDSKVTIDDLVYPDASMQGHQALDLLAGVFEFISGKIARDDHRDVSILTPAATIGIRGTQFIFGELTVGMPAGQSHYGYQIIKGAIEVTSPGGSVTLDEPGEGTFLPLTGVVAPTPPRIWPSPTAAEPRALLSFD